MKLTGEQRTDIRNMIAMYADDPGPSAREALIDAIEETLSEDDAVTAGDMTAYYARLRNEALA